MGVSRTKNPSHPYIDVSSGEGMGRTKSLPIPYIPLVPGEGFQETPQLNISHSLRLSPTGGSSLAKWLRVLTA